MTNNKFFILTLATLVLIAVACSKKSSEPLKGTWIEINDFSGLSRSDAASFVIGKYGYICTGYNGDECMRDVWQFDSETDAWIQKGQFPGIERACAVAFTIGNKGYMGLGYNGVNYMNDFWEYDPDSDTWTEKASFPGSGRSGAYGFSLAGKGYVGCGFDNNFLNDFYEYDPVNDKWTLMSTPPEYRGAYGNTFVYGGRGFVFGGENNGTPTTNFDSYNPSTDQWNQLRNTANTSKMSFDNGYTDLARESGAAFQIGNYAYVSIGQRGGTYLQSTWQYDIMNDLWDQVADFPGVGRRGAAYFTFDTYGIIIGGKFGYYYLDDVWKFIPEDIQD